MIKLTKVQKIILNELNQKQLRIGFLLTIVLGIILIINSISYFSIEVYYLASLIWGISLIILGIHFIRKAEKFDKRLEELLKK